MVLLPHPPSVFVSRVCRVAITELTSQYYHTCHLLIHDTRLRGTWYLVPGTTTTWTSPHHQHRQHISHTNASVRSMPDIWNMYYDAISRFSFSVKYIEHWN